MVQKPKEKRGKSDEADLHSGHGKNLVVVLFQYSLLVQ
jgi:hypothetical protein